MASQDHTFQLTTSPQTTNAMNTERALQTEYAECRRMMLAASKNYSFASHFLPSQKLRHVEALYAVLRVGDDRVDVSHQGFASAREAIEDWRDSYFRAFEAGDSPYPILRAYLNTAQAHNMPVSLLEPYFRAMLDDLTITRFATFDDLLYYMEGSAMVVGRAMCHILGTRTKHIHDAYPPAESLSVAMQLSNFWRDIGEDWRRGRVYLPQEDMQRFGVTEVELAQQKVTPGLVALLEHEIERTLGYYEQARQGISLLQSGQWGVLNALEIYRSILDAIRRNKYDVFTRRAGSPAWRKAWLVARAWWQLRSTHIAL